MAFTSSIFLGTQIRPSFLNDSDINVSFDWWSPETGIQVGWIWVKQGLAKCAPFLWIFQTAETLLPMALVEEKPFPYPPEAITTAWAPWRSIFPLTRLQVMIPGFPVYCRKSIISWRLYILIFPRPICSSLPSRHLATVVACLSFGVKRSRSKYSQMTVIQQATVVAQRTPAPRWSMMLVETSAKRFDCFWER